MEAVEAVGEGADKSNPWGRGEISIWSRKNKCRFGLGGMHLSQRQMASWKGHNCASVAWFHWDPAKEG